MAAKTTPGRQTTDHINYLNIGLMAVSAGLACVSPFYLFLVAYAVLGPLHYLTEISWLHDRHYFTNDRRDYWLLAAAGVVYSFGVLVISGSTGLLPNVIVIAFLGSFIFVLTRNLYWRAGLLLVGGVAAMLVPLSFPVVITCLLLLTLLHVFFFTGLFMLFGALKSSSVSGYVSFGVFVVISAALLVVRPVPSGETADTFVLAHYTQAFGDLNIWLLRTLGLSSAGPLASDPFEFSPGAVAVMRFIAFAYLYHYLNWFSKTKIIGWHEISKGRLAAILSLWAAAIAAYAIDYDFGIKLLFTLSAMHVLLEFPLDVRTMIGIAAESKKRAASSGMKLHTASS